MDALDDMFNTHWRHCRRVKPSGAEVMQTHVSLNKNNNDTRKIQKRFLEAENKTKLITMIYLNRSQEEIYNMLEYWLPITSFPQVLKLIYLRWAPLYDYIFSIKGKQTLVGINAPNGETYSAIWTPTPWASASSIIFWKGIWIVSAAD